MGVSSTGLKSQFKVSLCYVPCLDPIPLATVGLPVVGAVIMGGPGLASGLVIQEAIAAGLQGQGPVGAFVKLVAAVLLR